MKILVLSKRQYMGKDLIDDEYGRYYMIPMCLADLGHELQGICWSYKNKPEAAHTKIRNNSKIIWQSINLGKFYPSGIFRYLKNLKQVIIDFKPDIIWAGSDSFHAIIGKHIETHYNIPCTVDLYDNYESYAATSIPGVTSRYKNAVASVSAVTCISDNLNQYVSRTCRPSGQLVTLTNAIPDDMFYPMDKLSCRDQLNLPADGKLIGTAGALSENRGISCLFDAFKILQANNPKLYLVLAGPKSNRIKIPEHNNIIYLGELAYKQIPRLFNSLDVAIICNLDDNFGKFCFPQKFYEINACHTPVVAAASGDISMILESYPDLLYPPDDAIELSRRISSSLKNPVIPDVPSVYWQDIATRLQSTLKASIDLGRSL